MTPAITLLKKKRIAHTILKYDHDSKAPSYGLEAADKLDLDPNTVFKTLIVSDEASKLAVALVPVNTTLSEKKLAKVLGVKKITMAPSDTVVASTGYLLGGVSPLGQKKRLATVLHESALAHEMIYVSAGKRGLELEIPPQCIINLTQAKTAQIAAD
ncbi:Cys-tRNA(Pro) deacylase [Alteromonas sp. KS69]|jgi:Cys-tRNA(Pro)/Cys-tRNA(Cys) deacylase|uniref:Cys-tRNA(Pro) deacylase n=1 Tax=Alteromonas sp. KS69 TaxID=2109917 RepID=UPI000F898491|nr:Cys-tRNA(Pro) deacylase [Alteromonas sp. KS69]RUP76093.1 Cys-tRNA(Pro) deacylase [Alteromonas sp. KS69]